MKLLDITGYLHPRQYIELLEIANPSSDDETFPIDDSGWKRHAGVTRTLWRLFFHIFIFIFAPFYARVDTIRWFRNELRLFDSRSASWFVRFVSRSPPALEQLALRAAGVQLVTPTPLEETSAASASFSGTPAKLQAAAPPTFSPPRFFSSETRSIAIELWSVFGGSEHSRTTANDSSVFTVPFKEDQVRVASKYVAMPLPTLCFNNYFYCKY